MAANKLQLNSDENECLLFDIKNEAKVNIGNQEITFINKVKVLVCR